MVTPKHLRDVPQDRQAVAPYNFVELPDKTVSVKEPLPDHNSYHSDRHTGKIECTLTTSSPLYIRCGLSPTEFKEFGSKKNDELSLEEKEKKAEFFKNPASQKPMIPGSSLRGMLRSLIEIVGYGKLDKISDQQLIYRAVGDTTSLGRKYRDCLLKDLGNNTYSFLMKAGYIIRQESGWKIQPAKEVTKECSFARIEQENIPKALKSWKKLKNAYEITVRVSPLQTYTHNNGRVKLHYAKAATKEGKPNGVLVKTGRAPRKHMEFVIGLPDDNATLLSISDELLLEYKEQITKDQKKLLGDSGALQPMQPVFYIVEDEKLIFFGHTMMFRLPYRNSVKDFFPAQPTRSSTDLAEAIFGFIRDPKEEKSRSGRIFLSNAICTELGMNIWFDNDPLRIIIPKILGGPKPTTFQHYLVQTSADKEQLKHYASEPGLETVLRGHKLYWHKGVVQVDNIQETDRERINQGQSQYTKIKPIKPGIAFKFTIYFENLNKVELGAILWVLDIAQNDEYRISLGMGKPLGMGAVKIEHNLYLSNRQRRYEQLFEGEDWAIAESLNKDKDDDLSLSIEPMTNQLKDIPRIKMLLAMLSWKETLPQDELNQRRYMEIARDVREPHIIGTPRHDSNTHNEYKDRPVLPTPLQIIELDDNRRVNNSPNSKESVFIRAFETYILDGISDTPPPPKFTLGQVVESKVAKLSTEEVKAKKKTKTTLIYEVEGERLAKQEEIYDIEKKGICLIEGDIVKLKITELNSDGNIKKYERLDSTESASS